MKKLDLFLDLASHFHGARNSWGIGQEKLLYNKLKERHRDEIDKGIIEIYHSCSIELRNETYSRKKHKVDVCIINHEENKINFIDVKSAGVSHTKPASDEIRVYQMALESYSNTFPNLLEYDCVYFHVRKDLIKKKQALQYINFFEQNGIKTYDYNEFLQITDEEYEEAQINHIIEYLLTQKKLDKLNIDTNIITRFLEFLEEFSD